MEKILGDVDRQMSTYRSDSDIERFNNLPANSCQPMPAPVLQLVRTGEQLSQASAGAFDLTVEPLLNLWGFGPQARQLKVPDAATLAEVRQRVGHQHLRIDGEQLCKDAAVEVDFNSIAAGYAVDRIAELLSGRYPSLPRRSHRRTQGCRPQTGWFALARRAGRASR